MPLRPRLEGRHGHNVIQAAWKKSIGSSISLCGILIPAGTDRIADIRALQAAQE